MLTLYGFGPYFGLPDGSPFCIKAMTLLKMSGLPHTVERMNFRKAPKGKGPYLGDSGRLISDSHFIMRHLETAHGADFSGGYSTEELATGWTVARMLEEHFYFVSMWFRWLDDKNFWKGPYQYFSDVPAPFRPFVARMIRSKVRKAQHLQGLGRHSIEERVELAKGDIDAVEALLGKNKYFLGDHPSFVDATVLGSLWAAECRYFESPVADYIHSRPKLMSYLTRMQGEFFPEFKT